MGISINLTIIDHTIQKLHPRAAFKTIWLHSKNMKR